MRFKEGNVGSFAAIDALLSLIERFHQELNRMLQFIWNLRFPFSNENSIESLKLYKNKVTYMHIIILHVTFL